MDWFHVLFGFHEGAYDDTRSQLEVDGRLLRSKVNGRSYGIGELELVSLNTLRERGRGAGNSSGRLKVRIATGDVRAMHQAPENVGALFQVASQFNLLEMISPDVGPEHGVTRYQFDRTQGPACAMAAGAATVYRNYFAPVQGCVGQTANRQLDGLADLGAALGAATGSRIDSLWRMRNGYAMCTRSGLELIASHLDSCSPEQIDDLRAMLRIGVHWDVEVTDSSATQRPAVSQVFCSALPVAYSAVPPRHWRAFATLVLESAYEATLWAAIENKRRGGSNIVLLTRLGGGAFGNEDDWIDGAMRRALHSMQDFDIDVRLVSYGAPSDALKAIASEFA